MWGLVFSGWERAEKHLPGLHPRPHIVPAPSKDIQRSGFHHPTESGSCVPLAQRRLLLECDILASRHGEFVEKSIFTLSVHAVVGGYWTAGLRAS